MPRAGGQADTAGGEYQAALVARLILDVIEEKIDSLRPHPPPLADFGREDLVQVTVDDVVAQAGANRIHYQAKTQAPRGGNWTPKRLAGEGVLRQFVSQLEADSGSTCVLMSSSPSRLLGELAERARNSPTEREFAANLSRDDQGLVEQMASGMGLSAYTPFEFLRKCKVDVVSHDGLLNEVRTRGEQLLLPTEAVKPALLQVARDAMRRGIFLDRTKVLDALAEAGLTPRPSAKIEDLEIVVHGASSELRLFPKEIEGVHIQRAAVEEALTWIRTGEFKTRPVAVFLDQAGSGKSAAMSTLLGRLEADGFVVLGFRIGGQPFVSAVELAQLLGLGAPISAVLEALAAAGRKVALLVDQVDAVSTAMARDPQALAVILDVVARVASSRNVPVVLACRSFDWRFDPPLSWIRDDHPREFNLPPFTDEELELLSPAY